MKHRILILSIIVLSILTGILLNMEFGFLTPSNAQEAAARMEKRDQLHRELAESTGDLLSMFSKVSDMASPSVVHISVEKAMSAQGLRDLQDIPFFGPNRRQPQQYKQKGEGSGMILDKDGYIITNNHVIDGSDTILVGLSDGRQFEADIIGADSLTDVALLKIKDEGVELIPVILGNSDIIKIGEWVVAIGNPLGLENTLTTGVVSAIGRSHVVPVRGAYENFIQTDAAINKGNSGGPLFNIRGEVIGMNTAIYTEGISQGSIGLGFAIPVNMIKFVVKQLKEDGSVTRGWLGVRISDIDRETAQNLGIDMKKQGSMKGVYVAEVLSNSPAEKGGLKKDDIIIELNGKEMDNTPRLRSEIAMITPGATAQVKVKRGGSEEKLEIEIGKKVEGEVAENGKTYGEDFYGMTLRAISAAEAQRFGYDKAALSVQSVRTGSAANKSGIEPFDIILKVGTAPVDSLEAFKAEADKYSVKEGIPLVVLDNQGQHAVELKE